MPFDLVVLVHGCQNLSKRYVCVCLCAFKASCGIADLACIYPALPDTAKVIGIFKVTTALYCSCPHQQLVLLDLEIFVCLVCIFSDVSVWF